VGSQREVLGAQCLLMDPERLERRDRGEKMIAHGVQSHELSCYMRDGGKSGRPNAQRLVGTGNDASFDQLLGI